MLLINPGTARIALHILFLQFDNAVGGALLEESMDGLGEFNRIKWNDFEWFVLKGVSKRKNMLSKNSKSPPRGRVEEASAPRTYWGAAILLQHP